MKITQFSRWKSVSPQIHGVEFVEHLPDANIRSRSVAEWQSSADMQPDLAWLSVLFRVGFVLFFLAKSGFARYSLCCPYVSVSDSLLCFCF